VIQDTIVMVGDLAFGFVAAAPRSLEIWKFENPSIVNNKNNVFQQFRSCRKLQISSHHQQITMRNEPELARASRKAFILQTLFAVHAIYGNTFSLENLLMYQCYIFPSLSMDSVSHLVHGVMVANQEAARKRRQKSYLISTALQSRKFVQ
jgi:hypothetical protein